MSQRMRQEDRLGRITSQLEQQRSVLELDRKSIESQLRVLADELGFERRRGLAQLLLIIVVIILGVATRSTTIDALLKPLLAEARRRKKSASSTSASMHEPPPERSERPERQSSLKRAGTPMGTTRRKTPNIPRSTSTNVDFLLSPRPRSSLPPRPHPNGHGHPRKIARSAHLHTLKVSPRTEEWASASEVDDEEARSAAELANIWNS